MLSGGMSEGYLSLYITPVICIFTDSSMGPTRGTPPAWLVLCYLGVCLRVVFLQILPCSAKRGRPLLVGAMLSGSMSGASTLPPIFYYHRFVHAPREEARPCWLVLRYLGVCLGLL